jgi:hypothetical protein
VLAVVVILWKWPTSIVPPAFRVKLKMRNPERKGRKWRRRHQEGRWSKPGLVDMAQTCPFPWKGRQVSRILAVQLECKLSAILLSRMIRFVHHLIRQLAQLCMNTSIGICIFPDPSVLPLLM